MYIRKREGQRETERMNTGTVKCGGGGQWAASRNWFCPAVWDGDQILSSSLAIALLPTKPFYQSQIHLTLKLEM